LRERIRRQASRRLRRQLDDYDRRVEELTSVERRRDDDVAREIAALEERLRASRTVDWSRLPSPELLSDLENALLLPEASWNRPPRPPGLGARIRAAFRRFLAWLRRLFSRSRAPAPRAPERTVTLAFPVAGGRALGPSELGEALARLSSPQREELAGRVESSIRARERALEREAEEKRKAAEAQRRQLEAERSELERRAGAETERVVRAAEERRFQQELRERGYVAEKDGGLVVTYGLVERFARLLLEEQSRRLPGDVRLSLKGSASTGIYEKARLARLDEVAHLDVPSSLLAARMAGSRHIDESTSYVYREITAESVHVVVAFDRSGSMAEGGKLDAAKRALLALYVAIRNRYSDATVDLLAFDNTVSVLDLLELWECKPGAFTNTAEALRAAHLLLRPSRASRRELYLITDGLPEAYTDPNGEVRSGQLDRAMEEALERSRELATVTPLRTTLILLRSDRPEYEVAARALARTLNGELVVTDPAGLGFELLIRWAHGAETERRIAPTAPRSPPPVPPAGRGRRRRADRRMGG
jgi:Mg-chelatase subunit ChlD